MKGDLKAIDVDFETDAESKDGDSAVEEEVVKAAKKKAPEK